VNTVERRMVGVVREQELFFEIERVIASDRKEGAS
jgi:hypothetical protein